MRQEKEMLDLITETALGDSRIRAAYLEGSRANPKTSPDSFQDFDIVYIVTETKSFREDRTWIDRFGERLYMQFPEEFPLYPSDIENCYGWLMQFRDGNRLDLHVCTPGYALSHLELYKVLVDKDGIMPSKQMTSDEIYWIKKPSQKLFSCTCNEFWWCLNNVAKGLWRKEIPYVMDILNDPVRPMLKQMLEWKIGIAWDFSVNAGKSGKYMEKYLPDNIYRRYLLTYPNAQVPLIWDAVFTMCSLFEETAAEVAESLGYSIDQEEAANSRKYLEQIQRYGFFQG